jgi:beta-aspartyl-peptidase (threonine type)
MSSPRFTVAVHGGAGVIAKWIDSEPYRIALEKILLNIFSFSLSEHFTALDIAEYGVKLLEDEPLFNAGKGAVFTADATHELEASLMDGRTLKCGAVSLIQTIEHPVAAARKVMENTKHNYMIGSAAESIAKSAGLATVDPSFFSTEKRRHQLSSARTDTPDTVFRDHDLDNVNITAIKNNALYQRNDHRGEGSQGTVGCVCMYAGDVAAATSTGGMTNKLSGRIGDTTIIGAGTYANNRTCAVSATGTGEEFMRHVAAYDISARMEYGHQNLHDAVHGTVFTRLPKDSGGVIAVDPSGNCEMQFNCDGMFRGMCDWTGKGLIGIWDEVIELSLSS